MKRWEALESGLLVPGRCDIGIHLGVTMLLMSGGGSSNDQSLYGIIQAAGLTSNLQVCLDAGSLSSYPGSGQTWSDLSGNGYDFLLGADNSATATDPTFNGVAGAGTSSEYFSVDGGDYFTLDESANPAAFETMHKDNAALSWVAAVYTPGTWGANDALWGTSNGQATNSIGITVACATGAGKLGVRVSNGSGTVANAYPDSAITTGAWRILGGSINEATGAGGGFLYDTGGYSLVSTADTFNSTYSSPSASSAAYKMQILAAGNGGNPMANGARIACFALWSGVALSKANLDAIYGASPAVGLRARFGI